MYFRLMVEKSLDKRIASLLREHDCVIVPRFGGFVANYKPAHIHPRLKVICPPSKSISFNRQLLRNDGLLANYIAEKEEISYDAALAYIDTTVKSYRQELELGNRLEIEEVGSIYLDKNGLMQFIPDNDTNYLPSSFGLRNIPLPETIEEDTPIVPIAREKEEEEKKRATPWWVGAAAVALPLALISLFFFNDVFKGQSKFELAALNPLRSACTTAHYSPATDRPEISIVSGGKEESTLESIIADLPETSSELQYNFIEGNTDPSGITIQLKEEAVLPDVSESNLKLYYVIAGAFEMKSNADGLVSDLRDQGFDAALIGKRGRLHLVSYGAYTNRKAAKQSLRSLQADNKQGWIYKK
jgi:hypothetical protein